ncbi:hypothetical protein BH18ACT8_BH18ACT8_17280 [soil metagenome]
MALRRQPHRTSPVDAEHERRHVVDEQETTDVMVLFDSAYTLMTLMLLRFFAHTDEDEHALRTLARSAVDLMEDVIAPLGSLLAKMPTSSSISETAGASFEFYRSATLLPHREPAWIIFHERLVELAAHAQRLDRTQPDLSLDAVATALANTAAAIGHHVAPHRNGSAAR